MLVTEQSLLQFLNPEIKLVSNTGRFGPRTASTPGDRARPSPPLRPSHRCGCHGDSEVVVFIYARNFCLPYLDSSAVVTMCVCLCVGVCVWCVWCVHVCACVCGVCVWCVCVCVHVCVWCVCVWCVCVCMCVQPHADTPVNVFHALSVLLLVVCRTSVPA